MRSESFWIPNYIWDISLFFHLVFLFLALSLVLTLDFLEYLVSNLVCLVSSLVGLNTGNPG